MQGPVWPQREQEQGLLQQTRVPASKLALRRVEQAPSTCSCHLRRSTDGEQIKSGRFAPYVMTNFPNFERDGPACRVV